MDFLARMVPSAAKNPIGRAKSPSPFVTLSPSTTNLGAAAAGPAWLGAALPALLLLRAAPVATPAGRNPVAKPPSSARGSSEDDRPSGDVGDLISRA